MCYIVCENLKKTCTFKEALMYKQELTSHGHKSKIFNHAGEEIVNVTISVENKNFKKENKNMGYQEVFKKVTNLKELKVIEKALVRDGIEAFAEFVGAHQNPSNTSEFYLFFATDRHPGADYLINNFGFKNADMNNKEVEAILCFPFVYPKVIYKKLNA